MGNMSFIDQFLSSQSASPKPRPPELTISIISKLHLAAFRRLTTLLIPVRYPDSFYKATLELPEVSAFSRIALWGKEERVVAAIRCIAESVPSEESIANGGNRAAWETTMQVTDRDRRLRDGDAKRIYVSTLFTLSPYRKLGIATFLLKEVVDEAIKYTNKDTDDKSQKPRCEYMYAHVWASNEDAISWYRRNQFVEWGSVEGYYPRLDPSKAIVMRRWLQIEPDT
jgi:ribosomal protein S18 acetylase RimI-like enzyme